MERKLLLILSTKNKSSWKYNYKFLFLWTFQVRIISWCIIKPPSHQEHCKNHKNRTLLKIFYLEFIHVSHLHFGIAKTWIPKFLPDKIFFFSFLFSILLLMKLCNYRSVDEILAISRYWKCAMLCLLCVCVFLAQIT